MGRGNAADKSNIRTHRGLATSAGYASFGTTPGPETKTPISFAPPFAEDSFWLFPPVLGNFVSKAYAILLSRCFNKIRELICVKMPRYTQCMNRRTFFATTA